jgi:undecaprenyl pyrophosphate phosphatase UppP
VATPNSLPTNKHFVVFNFFCSQNIFKTLSVLFLLLQHKLSVFVSGSLGWSCLSSPVVISPFVKLLETTKIRDFVGYCPVLAVVSLLSEQELEQACEKSQEACYDTKF